MAAPTGESKARLPGKTAAAHGRATGPDAAAGRAALEENSAPR
jgi:hypothetical protein